MKIVVRPKSFPSFGKDTRTHFLLRGASARCTVFFEEGKSVEVSGTPGASGSFELDISPSIVPDRTDAASQAVAAVGGALLIRQQITRIDLVYEVKVTLATVTFTILRVTQRLNPMLANESDRVSLKYSLTAGGWLDALGNQRISNSATHPLVDTGAISKNELVISTLILDITNGWNYLHRNNRYYTAYNALMQGRGLSLRVFAHTAGVPFIWYAVVPQHLRGSKSVSPHIFLQPSDNREGQFPTDDERYLLNNEAYFEEDGRPLINYLSPPIPDTELERMKAFVAYPTLLRNVVNFTKVSANPLVLTTLHWNIGAGLAKAFEHMGDGAPSQFLLLPQRTGKAGASQSGAYGAAVSASVSTVTSAIFDVLETQTDLTASGRDVLLSRDKLVFSAYSESGYDLWQAAAANRNALKAIIAIEPQNMNSATNDYRPRDSEGGPSGAPPVLGKDIIPDLIKRKIAVFLIGRHHLPQYSPQVADATSIRKLPAKPSEVFQYPPDPSVNDFIKYRVQRVLTPDVDPYLLDAERTVMNDLAAQGIAGAALFAKVFNPAGNEDKSVRDGLSRWYSHQFALSGGEELKLDPSGIYDKPIYYRTWFQVAVQEIG